MLPLQPAPRRRLLPLVLLALVAVAVLVLLWWVDPGEVDMPLCMFHRTTGWHCPGCGATRATHELLHGRVLSALHYHALWILSLPLVAYWFASHARALYRGRVVAYHPRRMQWLLIAVVIVVVLFGVLRNVPVYPLTLLAPPG